MTKHGTISRYTGGCRCQRCRAANAEYQRAYQARRKAGTTRIAPYTIKRYAYETVATTSRGGVVTGRTYLIGDKGPEHFFTASVTQPQSVTVDTRQPLERTLDMLVAACQDLRQALNTYQSAKTGEPA